MRRWGWKLLAVAMTVLVLARILTMQHWHLPVGPR